MYFSDSACFSVPSPWVSSKPQCVFRWHHRHMGNLLQWLRWSLQQVSVSYPHFLPESQPDTFPLVSTASCAVHSFLVSVRRFLHPRPSSAGFTVAGPSVPIDCFASGAEPEVFLSQHLLYGVSWWPNLSFFLSRWFLGDSTIGFIKTNVVLDNPVGCRHSQAPSTAISPSRGLLVAAQLVGGSLHFLDGGSNQVANLRDAASQLLQLHRVWCSRRRRRWLGGARRFSETVAGELRGRGLFPAPPAPLHRL
ncbi:uncharacterized protein [Macaca nemestrina]|uniref:uncharacterized protein n=1 Tax=Macaca nemestrina TaxID=9545 RepID=UPI0039B8680E